MLSWTLGLLNQLPTGADDVIFSLHFGGNECISGVPDRIVTL